MPPSPESPDWLPHGSPDMGHFALTEEERERIANRARREGRDPAQEVAETEGKIAGANDALLGREIERANGVAETPDRGQKAA